MADEHDISEDSDIGISNISKSIREEDAPQTFEQSADTDSLMDEQDLEDRNLQRERYKRDTKNRDSLAKATMGLIVGWLIFVAIIILSCGCGDIELSDAVVCTLLATTTANILGLASTVLKGYFRYMNQDIELFQKLNKKRN